MRFQEQGHFHRSELHPDLLQGPLASHDRAQVAGGQLGV